MLVELDNPAGRSIVHGGTGTNFDTAYPQIHTKFKTLLLCTPDTATQGTGWYQKYAPDGYYIYKQSGNISNLPAGITFTNLGSSSFDGSTAAPRALQNPSNPSGTRLSGASFGGGSQPGKFTSAIPFILSVYTAYLYSAVSVIPITLSISYTGSPSFQENAVVQIPDTRTNGVWSRIYCDPLGVSTDFFVNATGVGSSDPIIMAYGIELVAGPSCWQGPLTHPGSFLVPQSGAAWKLDCGSRATAPTLTALRVANLPPPQYPGSGSDQAQNNQLCRQIDQLTVKTSPDGSTYTTVAGPYSGSLPEFYPGLFYTEIPVSGASPNRYLGAFVESNINPDGAGVSGLQFIGTVPSMGAFDRPLPPTISPASKAVQTILSPVAVTMACQTAGASIYYTTDNSLPTADSTGNALGTTTLYTAPLSISSTTRVRAISGINNPAYTGGAQFVYSRSTDVTEAQFTVSDTRITPNLSMRDDGIPPYWGSTNYYSRPMGLMDMCVLDDTARTGKFYAYGQWKSTSTLYGALTDPEYPGIFCYSTNDLVTWHWEGRVVQDWTGTANSQQRPVVNYIAGQYVMLYHLIGSVGVAYSATPTGPFTPYSPLHMPSVGDITVFADGTDHYLVYSAGGVAGSPTIGKLLASGLDIDTGAAGFPLALTWNGTGSPVINREGYGAFKTGGYYYIVSSAANYYNSYGEMGVQYISATTIAGLATATPANPWQGGVDTLNVDQNGTNTGSAITNTNATSYINASGIPLTIRQRTNTAYNVQPSNCFLLGPSSKPILIGDWYYSSANSSFNFPLNGLTMLPVGTSSGVMTLPIPSAWDFQDYFPSTSAVVVTGASTGTIGVPQTVNYKPDVPFVGSHTVTFSDGASGTFSPTSYTWAGTGESAAVTYTPTAGGAHAVGGTDSGGTTVNALTVTVPGGSHSAGSGYPRGIERGITKGVQS